MDFVTATDFTGRRAWDALPIAEIAGAGVRLHWTDQPYVWHVNVGAEVFVVLDGQVEMRWREGSAEHRRLMRPGDLCHAAPGEAHVAHPQGPARVLVIEQPGSF